MTFAAPIPELFDRDVKWDRPLLTADALTARQLPPPPPGAVPVAGPAPWSVGPHRFSYDGPPSGGAHSVVGREVVDAFELVWPTGEIDEQFLGGPLSEMPAPGAPFGEALRSDSSPPPLPMTVRLKPLTAPPEVLEPAWSEPVSDDVVLAIQRAIAAIGSELAVADRPLPAPSVPERSTGPVAALPDPSAPDATRRRRRAPPVRDVGSG